MRALLTMRCAGVVGALLLLPAAWTAPSVAADDMMAIAQAEEQREKQAEAAQEFVQRLGLTRRQARKLVPILEAAAGHYIEAYREEVALLPQMMDAYGDFLAEDKLDNGFSEAVERRTARLHHREIALPDRMHEALIDLEEEASAVLKPIQREFAEAYRPGKPFIRKVNRQSARQGDPLAVRQKELSEIGKARHPRVSRLGGLLFRPAAYAEVCQVARSEPSETLAAAARIWREGTDEVPMVRRDGMRAELRLIRGEINNWNLINGLQFDQKQIGGIVEVYDKAVWETQMAAGYMDCAQPLAGHRLKEVEQAVEQLLAPAQLQVIRTYKPCLLPPKDLKNPVRVGQADDSSAMERWLERARRTPHDRLADMAEATIERETKHYGELSKDDARRRKTLLMNVARRAAKLDDVEFELSRSELAERIARPDRTLDLQVEIDSLHRAGGDTGLVARFMINDLFMDQLKERAQQLADGTVSAPVDLAGGEQAENCDKGCAVK